MSPGLAGAADRAHQIGGAPDDPLPRRGVQRRRPAQLGQKRVLVPQLVAVPARVDLDHVINLRTPWRRNTLVPKGGPKQGDAPADGFDDPLGIAAWRRNEAGHAKSRRAIDDGLAGGILC